MSGMDIPKPPHPESDLEELKRILVELRKEDHRSRMAFEQWLAEQHRRDGAALIRAILEE